MRHLLLITLIWQAWWMLSGYLNIARLAGNDPANHLIYEV